MKARVVSVNRSDAKGTVKTPVRAIEVTMEGVKGDAHSGAWHRQVSILSEESAARFTERTGRAVRHGEFAENITTAGLPLEEVRIPDRIGIGSCELEVTQIGKACHGEGCAIFREVGECLMPKEGIFCRVVSPGMVTAGDCMVWRQEALPFHVLTLSDRASKGIYEDRSGPAIADALASHFASSHWRASVRTGLIPDDADMLGQQIRAAVNGGAAAIFTTGGTGLGPRDITPDTIRPMLDREIPGVMEQIRVTCALQHPAAVLSRSIAGMIGRTLVFCLPGSRRAVTEYMTEILRNVDHMLRMVRGIDEH